MLFKAAGILVALAIAFSISAIASSANCEKAYAATNGSLYVTGMQDDALAQDILKQINKNRAKKGLGALAMDKSLASSALTRSAELVVYIPATSPHLRPNGKKGQSINGKSCYEICVEGWGPVTAQGFVKDWMSSASHRAGILMKDAKSIGIGCFQVDDTYFVTAEISKSKASPATSSRKIANTTKKVVANKKYFKAKCFSLMGAQELRVGDTDMPIMYFQGASTYNKILSPLSLSAKSFTWSSSNRSVATVNSKGIVVAKKVGTTKITAKLKGTNISKTIKLSVTDEAPNMDHVF